MPKLTVEGAGTFDVATGKRLVLAIEEAGVDILHACGGNAAARPAASSSSAANRRR